MSADFKAIHAGTQTVYERQAESWDQSRPRVFYERPQLERLTATVPNGGRVLDLGCGAGEPIAAYFLQHGYDVTGVDYAAPMLAIAQKRYPNATWIKADMRRLPKIGLFHAVISWDGFFHLSPEEQRAALPDLARLVLPGGSLLFTVGHEEGEVTGTVGGETVYHGSLSPEAYHQILAGLGFEAELSIEDPDAWGRSILFARQAA